MNSAIMTIYKNDPDRAIVVEICRNGGIKIIPISTLFYEVNDTAIIFYETIGDKENPRRGEIMRRVYIADCDFEKRILEAE